MATFAIIPGGGDSPISWGPVVTELRALGHEAIAVDLPTEDPNASWPEYVEAVVAAVRGKPDVHIVGHSLGGFTAPLVCDRIPVKQLILVAAMIPTPGASVGTYWEDSGYHDAQFDEEAFFHDLSPEARALAKRAERPQQDLNDPSPLKSWPQVPTHYLLARHDRVLSAGVSRRLVPERLGIQPDEIDGGHCVYLARPAELAKRLHDYVRG